MSDRAAVLLVVALLCGVVPLCTVLIVATLRSYTITFHMVRQRRTRQEDEHDE